MNAAATTGMSQFTSGMLKSKAITTPAAYSRARPYAKRRTSAGPNRRSATSSKYSRPRR